MITLNGDAKIPNGDGKNKNKIGTAYNYFYRNGVL